MDSKHGHHKRRANIDSFLKNQTTSSGERKNQDQEQLKKKFRHLKANHELQNRTVRHFMHNIMSPLSAVSGYLELLSNNLPDTENNPKLSRYTNNISDGLNEIGFLLEQLHEIYKDDSHESAGTESPVVEVNWLVNEVKEIVAKSTELRSSEIKFTESERPVFVKAELFQIKLMIYNLFTTADSFSGPDSTLEIEVDSDESEFALLIRSTGDLVPEKQFNEVFNKKEIVRLTDEIEESSQLLLGLKICAQISDQINGRIIMDKRDRKTPQFVLTAPIAKSNTAY